MFSRRLSTEAGIGKILVVVSVILKIIGIAALLFFGSLFPHMMYGYPGFMFLSSLLYLAGIASVIGLIFGLYSYSLASKRKIRDAGIYAIVSSLLPPLDIIMLAAGILFLVSREGKK